MRDRNPRNANRTADDRPRDRKRTARAKSDTLRLKAARQRKRAIQGRV